MSVTAKAYIEHERLALVPTLKRLDGVDIRVVTQGNTDPESAVFPFIIEYNDWEELEASLDGDPTVEQYELVDRTDGTSLYYIEHCSETKLISRIVTRVNGLLARTKTKDDGWVARMLLPDREALTAIWEYAEEHDIQFDLMEVYSKAETGAEESYGLTDEQKAALEVAHEMGYFNEPRDVSLSEVAGKLDLSSTAVSGRLRRGIQNLVSATIRERDTSN